MNVPVKRGQLLRHEGRLYTVQDVIERHSAKQRPTFHVFLQDAQDARHIQRTLDQLLPLEEVAFAYHTVQFLYARGAARMFMDNESFEEVDLGEQVRWAQAEPFLVAGQEFRVAFAGETPLRIELPDSVTLRVADTAAPAHAIGSGGGGVLKEARLENGLSVNVPLFIRSGDLVRISTHTRQYLAKSHGE